MPMDLREISSLFLFLTQSSKNPPNPTERQRWTKALPKFLFRQRGSPNWGTKSLSFLSFTQGRATPCRTRRPVRGQGSQQSHTGRRPPATCARPSPALPSPARYPASGPPSPALAAASPWSGPPRPRAGGNSAPRSSAPGPPPPSRTGL